MSWQTLWNEYLNINPGLLEICLRLVCAMVVGLVIGIEREYTHRPAGMRTHILVALGACAVSITGEMIFHQYSALGSSADPARLTAQVITGVGFLGAGTIMREGVNVKGLTTAASVWTVACLGVAAGYGYYTLALIGMLLVLITLTLLEKFQHRLIGGEAAKMIYVVQTKDLSGTLNLINEKTTPLIYSVSELRAEEGPENWQITFTARFHGRSKKHPAALLQALLSHNATKSVQQSDHADAAVL